jgi:hypothetical protein
VCIQSRLSRHPVRRQMRVYTKRHDVYLYNNRTQRCSASANYCNNTYSIRARIHYTCFKRIQTVSNICGNNVTNIRAQMSPAKTYPERDCGIFFFPDAKNSLLVHRGTQSVPSRCFDHLYDHRYRRRNRFTWSVVHNIFT